MPGLCNASRAKVKGTSGQYPIHIIAAAKANATIASPIGSNLHARMPQVKMINTISATGTKAGSRHL